jgi:type VI secretion system secreted protein Hcp
MATYFTLSVKAAKQGDLNGESGRKRNLIPILGFRSEVTSPRDPSSGQASGKRIHKPIVVYKEWGVISPQLFQALVTNENLPVVVIDEFRTNPRGIEAVYMEIRLINAQVASIVVEPQRVEDQPVWTNKEIEAVSFTFQKIEIENKASKVTAVDDWLAP